MTAISALDAHTPFIRALIASPCTGTPCAGLAASLPAARSLHFGAGCGDHAAGEVMLNHGRCLRHRLLRRRQIARR
jgi:hypothetical protein